MRTGLEQYTLKIMKILRTLSLGSNFTGSYTKKSEKEVKFAKFICTISPPGIYICGF